MARILDFKISLHLPMKKILSNTTSLFRKQIFALIFVSSLFSCKKEEIITKEITYQLSGDFGKSINVTYTPTNGTIANETENINLPWQKIVLPNMENASVGLVVKGENGKPNSTIIAKIFVDGLEQQSTSINADFNGNFSFELNHIFN